MYRIDPPLYSLCQTKGYEITMPPFLLPCRHITSGLYMDISLAIMLRRVFYDNISACAIPIATPRQDTHPL